MADPTRLVQYPLVSSHGLFAQSLGLSFLPERRHFQGPYFALELRCRVTIDNLPPWERLVTPRLHVDLTNQKLSMVLSQVLNSFFTTTPAAIARMNLKKACCNGVSLLLKKTYISFVQSLRTPRLSDLPSIRIPKHVGSIGQLNSLSGTTSKIVVSRKGAPPRKLQRPRAMLDDPPYATSIPGNH
ncbi:hypothetical protein J6590_063895 [Homalodisca vitripennis]|nr:hypothetical protein J6590_063895 [Homalodisca vitripennis]